MKFITLVDNLMSIPIDTDANGVEPDDFLLILDILTGIESTITGV